MQTRELEKRYWKDFFDQVSSALQGKLIKIEVASLDLGAQIEADRISLNGLSYDIRGDTFIVDAEALEHFIRSPQRIFVADGDEGINSIDVRCADGTEQILSFSEPLALPKAN